MRTQGSSAPLPNFQPCTSEKEFNVFSLLTQLSLLFYFTYLFFNLSPAIEWEHDLLLQFTASSLHLPSRSVCLLKRRFLGLTTRDSPRICHFSKNPRWFQGRGPWPLRNSRGLENHLQESKALCSKLPSERIKLVNTKTNFQCLTNHFPAETRCCRKQFFLSKDVVQV